MSDIKLTATLRTDFGKGAARRTRREGLIPAVLYGHGTDPLHVSLPGHETFLALKHSNALFTIDVEGDEKLAIVRDVQRDPVRQVIEHVDLLLVKKGEKVNVEVNIVVVGDAAPGTMHVTERQTLEISADATDLPESLEVDITGLEAGAVVRAADVKLPAGAELLTDAESDIVLVSEVRSEAAESAEEATEEA
ncbi:large subunit ribosomal protein L25 [Flavimobilis soli]|uniref:Large ribosomal subunit protein bL25 n=1 Tax=Flavimobilis soli TaxID=442709 RepID=A0A2A9EEZ6_9MICO|nr:50S ribosomal protein L25/general stress protein Ctc [Flavimobilis soli]PFG37498.1 large subunit ribosomal protein L25 [Flavimobilis soli]